MVFIPKTIIFYNYVIMIVNTLIGYILYQRKNLNFTLLHLIFLIYLLILFQTTSTDIFFKTVFRTNNNYYTFLVNNWNFNYNIFIESDKFINLNLTRLNQSTYTNQLYNNYVNFFSQIIKTNAYINYNLVNTFNKIKFIQIYLYLYVIIVVVLCTYIYVHKQYFLFKVV